MPININSLQASEFQVNPVATEDNFNEMLARDTTVINGGRISTGTIDAGAIGTGVIYNSGGSSSNYTMKIDLANGSIHIK